MKLLRLRVPGLRPAPHIGPQQVDVGVAEAALERGHAGPLPFSTAPRKRAASSFGNLRRSKVTSPGLTMSRPWQVWQNSS